MNNEMSVRLGNVICMTVWIVEGIASCIFALISSRMNNLSALILLLSTVFCAILLFKSRQNEEKIVSVFLPFIIFSTVLAYFIAIFAGGAFLMCMLYIMQWLLCIFYLEKSVCYGLGAFQIFALFALYIPSLINVRVFNVVDINQLTLAVVSIAICTWIALNLVGIFNIERRISVEQKQSLDDMLRVVEVICEESKDSTDAKTDFISKLTRIFNSSTKSVQSMVEQLRDEKDLERVSEYTDKILDAGEALRFITNEVAIYNQLERRDFSLSEKRYFLGDVLEKVLRSQLPRLKEKRNEVKLNIAENVPYAMVGDAKYLEILIGCIFANAVKYTDRGVITINIFLSKNIPGNNKHRLRIDIEDTGRGIRTKDKENIFMPFYRAEDASMEDELGIGLGLYIASELASMMGGDILVTSDYGKGSIFYIELLQGVDWRNKEEEHVSLYDQMQDTLSTLLSEAKGSSSKQVAGGSAADATVIVEDMAKDAIGSKPAEDMFPAIKGIDWSVTLSFLPSKPVVIATLNELVKSGYDNAEELRKLYAGCQDNFNEVAPEYKIKVHAIKSNLKMVGAVELSDRAKDLEYASRDLDQSFVFANTESFINDYIELINAVGHIPELAQKKTVIKQSFDKDIVIEKLNALVEAMENFDTDGADALVSEIEGFDYDDGVAGGIREISSLVLKLDLDGVKAKVSEIEGLM